MLSLPSEATAELAVNFSKMAPKSTFLGIKSDRKGFETLGSREGEMIRLTITEKLVWHVVKEPAAKLGLWKLAPHDLRGSCACLCHAVGGALEQIQFLLGHISVQSTDQYLGCKQLLKAAVSDEIGIEPVL
jgi:integrase